MTSLRLKKEEEEDIYKKTYFWHLLFSNMINKLQLTIRTLNFYATPILLNSNFTLSHNLAMAGIPQFNSSSISFNISISTNSSSHSTIIGPITSNLPQKLHFLSLFSSFFPANQKPPNLAQVIVLHNLLFKS